MNVIYANEKINILGKSIFLAGPIPRNNKVESWKNEALDILNSINFNGTVLVPEIKKFEAKSNYMNEINWDKSALEIADLIVFWIPRSKPDMLGLSSNIEFGYYISKKPIIYGRPNDAFEISYLDWFYKDVLNKKPCESLEELLKESVEMLKSI